MQKILFIDRDGTLIEEPKDNFQVDSFDKLKFLQQVNTYLKKIVDETDYKLVMVTNQDGLGTKSFPEKTFWPVHNLMLSVFETEGIILDDIFNYESSNYEDKDLSAKAEKMFSDFEYKYGVEN